MLYCLFKCNWWRGSVVDGYNTALTMGVIPRIILIFYIFQLWKNFVSLKEKIMRCASAGSWSCRDEPDLFPLLTQQAKDGGLAWRRFHRCHCSGSVCAEPDWQGDGQRLGFSSGKQASTCRGSLSLGQVPTEQRGAKRNFEEHEAIKVLARREAQYFLWPVGLGGILSHGGYPPWDNLAIIATGIRIMQIPYLCSFKAFRGGFRDNG